MQYAKAEPYSIAFCMIRWMLLFDSGNPQIFSPQANREF